MARAGTHVPLPPGFQAPFWEEFLDEENPRHPCDQCERRVAKGWNCITEHRWLCLNCAREVVGEQWKPRRRKGEGFIFTRDEGAEKVWG